MRPRELITLIGGAVSAWPLAVRAQQPSMPVIGFLNSASANAYRKFLESFRRGLGEVGFVEGQNVGIEFRWAEGQYDRLPELATDFVRRRVAVIVATGGPASGQAAKAATATRQRTNCAISQIGRERHETPVRRRILIGAYNKKNFIRSEASTPGKS